MGGRAFFLVIAVLLSGCAGRGLVIARVEGPPSSKGPTGEVVWTNNAGFLIKWELEAQPDFFVYTKDPASIRHTRSFDGFLRMLEFFHPGVRLDWIDTCGASVSLGMREDRRQRLRKFLSDHQLHLLTSAEGRTTICRCESTATVWFTEVKPDDGIGTAAGIREPAARVKPSDDQDDR